MAKSQVVSLKKMFRDVGITEEIILESIFFKITGEISESAPGEISKMVSADISRGILVGISGDFPENVVLLMGSTLFITTKQKDAETSTNLF